MGKRMPMRFMCSAMVKSPFERASGDSRERMVMRFGRSPAGENGAFGALDGVTSVRSCCHRRLWPSVFAPSQGDLTTSAIANSEKGCDVGAEAQSTSPVFFDKKIKPLSKVAAAL